MQTVHDTIERQFSIRLALPMAFFTFLVMGTPRLISSVASIWGKLLLALLPVLALIWATAVMVRHIARLDELQRRLHFEAGGFAGMLTCFLLFCWGVVEIPGVLQLLLDIPQLSAVAALPIFCASYCLRYWQLTQRVN